MLLDKHIHRCMQSKAKAKDPYSQYDKLASEGVSISWGNPADASSLPDGPFDIVYDNNGKALDVCKAAIDKYKVIHALHFARPVPRGVRP
jgi:hypothetical protein